MKKMLLIGSLVVFMMTGCGIYNKKESFPNRFKGTRKPGSSDVIRPTQAASPLDYGFDDVLPPKGLKLDKKSSWMSKNSIYSTGLMVYKGRIERDSLIRWFNQNMSKDNWRQVIELVSPRTRSFLLFKKDNRWCLISIIENIFNTTVEIGVAPTRNEDVEESLLK